MWRVVPILLLLAACESTSYSDADEIRETCRDLGYEGEAHTRCVARREHEAMCRRFSNSMSYTAAEARKRGCD